MRHLRWLPFAFIADVHGFAIFAPYAALMMAVALFAAHRQRARRDAQLHRSLNPNF